jgi:hypothetical protein
VNIFLKKKIPLQIPLNVRNAKKITCQQLQSECVWFVAMWAVVTRQLDNMLPNISKKLDTQSCKQFLTSHGSGATYMKNITRTNIDKILKFILLKPID